MAKIILKSVLLAGVCFAFARAEMCYQKHDNGYSTYRHYFYCCGNCVGTYGDEKCEDFDGFTYSYSYSSCYVYWESGRIAGVTIGSLFGIGFSIGLLYFLCRTCNRKPVGTVIASSVPSGGGVTVITANMTSSSHASYPSVQTYPPNQHANFQAHPQPANHGPSQFYPPPTNYGLPQTQAPPAYGTTNGNQVLPSNKIPGSVHI